jgi:predicted nucleic-acid-binding Zn-ribbon protein
MADAGCPKCGCTVVVEGVRVLDRGDHEVQHDLSVAVYRHPAARLFKGEVTCSLWARVCGNCGYTELYAENPTALVKAAAAAQSLSGEPDPAAGPDAQAGA